MRRSLSIAVVGLSAVVSSGCGYVLKGAGEYPGYVECRGKGSVTGTGTIAAGAGIGGGGTNSFTLQVDCGDNGLLFQQGKEPPASAGSVVPPSLPPKTQ